MNYHEILGIKIDATIDEIKAAYRKKAVEYHPDKCKEVDAVQKFILVNNAYHALINIGSYPHPSPPQQSRKTYTPPPKRDVWNRPFSAKEEEDRINRSLWERFEKQKQETYVVKPRKVVYNSAPTEVDLWEQSKTKKQKFMENYWKEYIKLKSNMAYEEPEKFWDALDAWSQKNKL